MSHKILFAALLVMLALGLSVMMVDAQGPKGGGTRAVAALAGTGFTYQGQLKNGGALVNGNCDFTFALSDASSGGNQIGFNTLSGITLTNGLFTTSLDFGSVITGGVAVWLETSARCPTGVGIFTLLAPRQALTPAPMALALPGLYTQQNATSPNVIGGYSGNVITPTLIGATIGGGGQVLYINRVFDNYGTIGGGISNTVGLNDGNTSLQGSATVGGGYLNTASGSYSTVGGGISNSAGGNNATVGGGFANFASGYGATIPGGINNYATMSYTLAAGRGAFATNPGTFVWADCSPTNCSSSFDTFGSTADNQFLIRASGGMGVGTNSPSAQLNVSSGGNVAAPQLRIDQTNASDYARIRFYVSTAPNDWDIAVGISSTNAMNFYHSGAGNILTLSGSGNPLTVPAANSAYVTSGGVWTNGSDRNTKENFATLDPQEILARVNSLPISSWNYKNEDASVRHLGPMAQDFYAAFSLGQDDKHIGTVDEEGVALAAIQGMYQENQDLKARVAALESGNPVRASAIPSFDPNAFGFGALLLSALALYRTQRKGAK